VNAEELIARRRRRGIRYGVTVVAIETFLAAATGSGFWLGFDIAAAAVITGLNLAGYDRYVREMRRWMRR
jgi:hypothetical protein